MTAPDLPAFLVVDSERLIAIVPEGIVVDPLSDDVEIVQYRDAGWQDLPQLRRAARKALRSAPADLHLTECPVGAKLDHLSSGLPGATFVAATHMLDRLRMVLPEEELP